MQALLSEKLMSKSRASRRAFPFAKLDRKLAKYAIAGGAILGAPFTVHAGTIYSGILDSTVSGNTSPGNTLTVDFPGSATLSLATTTTGGSTGWYKNVASVSGTSMSFVDSGGEPAALSFGNIISTANATAPGGYLLRYGTGLSTTGFKGGNWPQDGSNAYLGLIFTSSSEQYTGWAQINVDVNGSFAAESATLVDYAYDTTPGESIAAGQTTAIPEPSSLALFALGGGALLALLRRRRAGAPQA